MAFCDPSSKAKTFVEEGIEEDGLSQELFFPGSLFKRQVSAPAHHSHGLFLRQISAPVQSGDTLVGLNRWHAREEDVADHRVDLDLVEPEWEPDEELEAEGDQVQSFHRQMSIMSECSAKAPSRQVTALSNWDTQEDWETIGASGMLRQQTGESWPTWDTRAANEQPSSMSYGGQQTAQPGTTTWMPPYPSTGNIDMRAAMKQAETMCALQSAALAKLDGSDQYPFRRKRESLIDLAKQQQEQDAENQEGAQKPGQKTIPVKFCPWCGGTVRPSFKFCVFCGNTVPRCLP